MTCHLLLLCIYDIFYVQQGHTMLCESSFKGKFVQSKNILLVVDMGQDLLPNTGDTFLSLPITDLCTSHMVYYCVSVPKKHATASLFNSAILIIGVKNYTMMNLTVTQPVTISVSNSIGDLTAGIQYSFVINRLQTVLIGSVDDLTGTKIVTNKSVSVLSGHQCAYIPTCIEKCNHLVEQVPLTTSWGRVYYTAPLATRRSYTIKVLAVYNSMHC